VRITAAGQPQPAPKLGSIFQIAREWKSGDTVEVTFPMRIRAERGYRNSLTILRGPLVFALPVGEDWRKVKGQEPHADWEVHPTSPWNYGLSGVAGIQEQERPVGDYPFSPEGAPVVLTAKARRIPGWTLVDAAAGPLPESPVSSDQPEETVRLIPYGSAKLRVTALPEVSGPQTPSRQ
jgi:hypothetical protein